MSATGGLKLARGEGCDGRSGGEGGDVVFSDDMGSFSHSGLLVRPAGTEREDRKDGVGGGGDMNFVSLWICGEEEGEEEAPRIRMDDNKYVDEMRC